MAFLQTLLFLLPSLFFFIQLPNVLSLTLFIDWVFATVGLLIELRISRQIFSANPSEKQNARVFPRLRPAS